jgi:hypothetical protein
MIKGRGERGKTKETLVQAIFALIMNQDRGLTASKIGKIVENATHKDRDSVRREFQAIFQRGGIRERKEAKFVRQIVRTWKEAGTTYYKLDVTTLMKLAHLWSFLGEKDIPDGIMSDSLVEYVSLTLREYLPQVVSYLQLWDPFLDTNYRIPQLQLQELIKYGVSEYVPGRCPSEGIMALRKVCEGVFDYLYYNIYNENLTRFFDLIESLSQRPTDSSKSREITNFFDIKPPLYSTRVLYDPKNIHITRLSYLLSDSDEGKNKADWLSQIPTLINNPIEEKDRYLSIYPKTHDYNNFNEIAFVEINDLTGSKLISYRWLKDLWAEGCRLKIDKEWMPRMPDLFYPDLYYNDTNDGYKLGLWAGYSNINISLSSRKNVVNNTNDGGNEQMVSRFYEKWKLNE